MRVVYKMRKCKETGDSSELEKERLAEQSRNSRGSDVVGSAEGARGGREKDGATPSQTLRVCVHARGDEWGG